MLLPPTGAPRALPCSYGEFGKQWRSDNDGGWADHWRTDENSEGAGRWYAGNGTERGRQWDTTDSEWIGHRGTGCSAGVGHGGTDNSERTGIPRAHALG